MILVDQKQEYLDKSLNIIQTSLKRVVKKKFEKDPSAGDKYFKDVQSRIQTSLDVNDAVKSTDIVIEAIIENLDIKQKLFKQLDQVAPKSVLYFVLNRSVICQRHSFPGIPFSPVIHHHYPLQKLLVMSNGKIDLGVYISSILCKNERTNDFD